MVQPITNKFAQLATGVLGDVGFVGGLAALPFAMAYPGGLGQSVLFLSALCALAGGIEFQNISRTIGEARAHDKAGPVTGFSPI